MLQITYEQLYNEDTKKIVIGTVINEVAKLTPPPP